MGRPRSRASRPPVPPRLRAPRGGRREGRAGRGRDGGALDVEPRGAPDRGAAGRDRRMSVSPSFAGTRALVTGGAGFIGSNLAIALAERGATVRVVDAMIPGYGGNHFNLEPVTGRVAVDVPREVEDDVLAAHVDSLPVAEEAPTNPRGLHEMPLGGALGVRAPFS